MLLVLFGLTLCCRQCQGKSEKLSNLDNFHQSVEDPFETKQSNQQNNVNSDESHRQKESLLEVVEVETVKPVLHGTLVRLSLHDGSCHLRMSANKYPAKYPDGT